MAENDENEQLIWVFDSLVGFLKGPVWNIPIMTFIEQKSIGMLIIALLFILTTYWFFVV